MAKGAESKSLVTKKILETFPDAFLYNNDKEIRIPLTEQGETVEIKVVLSCAKTPVREAAALDWSVFQSLRRIRRPVISGTRCHGRLPFVVVRLLGFQASHRQGRNGLR